MIGKQLSEVTMSDLHDLKVNCVRESRTLEYKLRVELDSRNQRKEFLADVTALANTAGGDMLIGVKENQGEPEDFPGVSITDWDELELRLTSLIRDGTEPRLQGVSFHRVATDAGSDVVILRVPRSYRRPHRVVLGGHGHFYGRDSAQKYRLDVEDLRRAFTQAANLSETVQQFRAERVELLKGDRGFSSISVPAKAVLHLVPEDSLDERTDLDLTALDHDPDLRPLPRSPLGYSQGVALDAVYLHNEQAYTAAFRSGMIEAAEGLLLHKRMLFPTPLQLDLVEGIRRYLSFFSRVGVDAPIRVLLTLIGVGDVKFPVWSIDAMVRPRRSLDRDVLELTGPVLDTLDVDPSSALRPLFDRLWNAFGYARCEDYDESGAWSPRERSIIA